MAGKTITKERSTPIETREIGKTGLRVTTLGLGGAALGGLYSDVTQDMATDSLNRALELGVRYFDTAPQYGFGKSETYIGNALQGVNRNDFVISTKIGRILEPVKGERKKSYIDDIFKNLPEVTFRFDYTRDGTLRSIEDSMKRLQVDKLDIVLIHDPNEQWHDYKTMIEGAYPALAELRSQGVIKAIGCGLDFAENSLPFMRDGDFDCFLIAGRYTLLEQPALIDAMPTMEKKGISVIIGGPYNSGVLASDLSTNIKYHYLDAPYHVLAKARRMKAVCDRYNVPLKAAALQFGLVHPIVAATIPGARTGTEMEDNVRMVNHPIPVDMWNELKHEDLLPEEAPTPTG
ncbi:MAG: aldo/keto reductase [Chloroflexi bacterium]|nr:aldo/keto reductase [Chloroflexota bacterium]